MCATCRYSSFFFLYTLEVGKWDAEPKAKLFHGGGALWIQASDVFGLFADETAGARVDGDTTGERVRHSGRRKVI